MSGRGGGPAFSGRTGGRGRITSLQARDAGPDGGKGRGGGRGRYKKPLNGNYIASREGNGQNTSARDENNLRVSSKAARHGPSTAAEQTTQLGARGSSPLCAATASPPCVCTPAV